MRFCSSLANCDALKYIIGRLRASSFSPGALFRVCGTIPIVVIEWFVVANRRRAHTWEPAHSLEQLIVKANDLLRRIVARSRQRNAHRQNATRIESKRHVLRTPKTLQCQARRCEKQDCKRNLCNHQDCPGPLSLRAATAAPTLFV